MDPYKHMKYPDALLDRIRAACRWPAVDGEVFVVAYECYRRGVDTSFTILAVFSRARVASDFALNLFHRDHANFFDDPEGSSSWVQRKPQVPWNPMREENQDNNTVVWEVRNGAVSLKGRDKDGDIYHVYVQRHWIQ